jgi:hypothetical protein
MTPYNKPTSRSVLRNSFGGFHITLEKLTAAMKMGFLGIQKNTKGITRGGQTSRLSVISLLFSLVLILGVFLIQGTQLSSKAPTMPPFKRWYSETMKLHQILAQIMKLLQILALWEYLGVCFLP